ncbi:uncharacterized protein LOC133802463 [Humulus lupulus]|uniref:uncharacterized protein LOC133802463 n=1 Tax=Humulus lupulus TaxID=3486 RepID=UPI002B408125|nr:uncharacterized protein LOC133802463 [Humulus lupulus]
MSSPFYSTTATHHRRKPQSIKEQVITSVCGPIQLDIDPGPNPRPVFKVLAFGSIILLLFLQFLPATHFRHPSDRLRNWFPFPPTLIKDRAFVEGSSSLKTEKDGNDGMVHIVSWMDCLDLRLLAVLANSTLSSSRSSEMIFFHFFIPNGIEDTVSYFKLKVLFPHSNIKIHGQEEVKEAVNTAISGVEYSELSFEKVAPFVIPKVHQYLKKFIYVSPSVIMTGRVEELIGIELSNYAVAAAENCDKKLSNLVNTDVLDAIQRSVSKPWVSETPYAKNSCVPDLNVLLINARKFEGDFLQAVLWWRKVLNQSERNGTENTAFVLALYNRYLKLSDPWLVREVPSLEIINSSILINYDGPKRVCSKFGTDKVGEADHGKIWRGYLPPLADRILGD